MGLPASPASRPLSPTDAHRRFCDVARSLWSRLRIGDLRNRPLAEPRPQGAGWIHAFARRLAVFFQTPPPPSLLLTPLVSRLNLGYRVEGSDLASAPVEKMEERFPMPRPNRWWVI